MKKLLLLAAVVAAAIFGYNHFINTPPASADESALAALEREFASASQAIIQSSRASGMSGLDTTSDIEAARARVRRLESDLRQIKARLAGGEALRRAERLEEKIRALREATD